MKIVNLVVSAALAGALTTPAFAQDPAAQPAQPQFNPTAPRVPGVCWVSIQNLVGSSQVGQFISTRVQQIAAQTNAELNEQLQALQAERSNVQARVNAVGPEGAAAEIEAYNQQAGALSQLDQLRAAELEQTEATALLRFDQEAGPVIMQVATEQQCNLVFERSTLVAADPRADITQQVVTALDAKITSFPISKVTLQPQAPAQGGQAPALP